jgi:cell division transport system ATP-binding protein
MVSARNISKKFGSISALSEISLEIGPGEFVFLTGPSGAGKTTLFRLLAKDLDISSGELEVLGFNLKKVKGPELIKLRRQLGIVFQDNRLFNDKNVWENIALPLQFRHLSEKDIQLAVKLALEMVGLQQKAEQFPAQLSGGELQRVSIARSIVGKPKLLLADEPTGNLDPKTAKDIVKLLSDIHTQFQTTIVMATHNSDIVNAHQHRVITLAEGKIFKDNPKGKYE